MNERRLLAKLAVVMLGFAVLSLPLLRVLGSDGMRDTREYLPVDIAIVGDSRAHVGLSPTKLVQGLARAGVGSQGSYNFAVDGTDVLHHFDFVARALVGVPPGERPRIILWAPNPLGFNDARTSNRLQQLTHLDLVALLRAGAPTELLLDLVTMRWFPPYGRRPVVAEKVATYVEIAGKKTLPLQRRLLGLSYEEPPRSREYHSLPDGHEPFTVLEWEDRFQRGARGYEADYAGLGKSAWHLAVGRALLRRAREAGVLVVVIELPVAPWFRAHLGGDPRHLAWRESLQEAARDEGALYLDHTALYDDDRRFGDPGHMADELAYAYSTQLGEVLAREPAVRAALAKGK